MTKEKAKNLFKKQGGILRTREALTLGIHPKTLYQMRDTGDLKLLNRGLYLLVDDDIDITHIDFIAAHKRLPRGVICLLSALAFHELTTQIPHAVYVAYQQNWRKPKMNYPPIKLFRYSEDSYEDGIEYHQINTLKIPIYSASKTVVDCFKFRNKIGLDIAIEALRDYWRQHKQVSIDEILRHAKVCRVTHVMSPYIDAIINGST